jgi:threonine synthase
MYEQSLECIECGTEYSPREIRYRCECGGSLDVIYDYETIKDKIDWSVLKRRAFDHHRYREFYPVVNSDHIISLGEGGTPLVRATTLRDEIGLDNLYFKLESLNPTGSFKDRGTSVEIGKALDFGADEIVVASTGNMGASIAAYCAQAGVTAHIFIPQQVPDIKLKQMKSYGATIHQVDGDYAEAAEQAYNAYREKGWYLMGDYAYRGEGEKSVGYEIVDQMQPDWIFLPIGNGTLMHGTYKGIREMHRLDLVDNVPKMAGIQSTGCNPVARAFKNGTPIEPETNVDTVAGAIACGDPLDGTSALNAVRESGGFGDDLPDEELTEAKRMLAEKEGIYAEESCGASLAGLIANQDRINPDDTVVCVITGHGLKT